MITLHRLNNSEMILNPHHIEFMEKTPDTVIHLINDHIYVVKESIPDIIEKIVEFNQRLYPKILLDKENFVENKAV